MQSPKPKKSIQCTTEPLQVLIDQGETIDFRLDQPQWADLRTGDIIEYWEDFTGWQTEPAPNSRTVTVTITDIFRARTFQDLLNHHDLATFFGHDTHDEIIASLRHWWDEEKEIHYGVLGLKVKIIPS